jgi:hypothetical protein
VNEQEGTEVPSLLWDISCARDPAPAGFLFAVSLVKSTVIPSYHLDAERFCGLNSGLSFTMFRGRNSKDHAVLAQVTQQAAG